MQIHFTLDDDADESLIAWWLSLPKGQRSDTMRQMMRWYSGQEGFGELIAKIDRLAHATITPGPVSEPPIVPAPPNISELMEDALSQLFDDDDH